MTSQQERQSGLWGCMMFIIIALLIGVAIRSASIAQFLVMGVATIFAVYFLFAMALGIFSPDEGCGTRIWALFYLIIMIPAFACAGNFLITGDYEQSIRISSAWNENQVTDTLASIGQSNESPSVTSTSAEIAQSNSYNGS